MNPNVFHRFAIVSLLAPVVVEKTGLNYPQPIALHTIPGEVAWINPNRNSDRQSLGRCVFLIATYLPDENRQVAWTRYSGISNKKNSFKQLVNVLEEVTLKNERLLVNSVQRVHQSAAHQQSPFAKRRIPE